MGRKGMKGFIKAAAKRPGEDGEEEEEEVEAAAAGPSATKQQPAAKTKAAAAPKPAAGDSEGPGTGGGDDSDGDDGSGGDGPESRNHMLQRHKREMLAHKKALQRSGKKSKDEVAKLTAAIEKRHAEELRALDAGAAAGGAGGGVAAGAAAPAAAKGSAGAAGAGAAAAAAAGAVASEPLSKYLKGMAVDDEAAGHSRKPSKAQKRREKHAAKDAEREARIVAEKEELGTPERLEEEAALKALLAPLGLGVKEIRADGHCMYRSVEDQLRATARAGAGAGGSGGDSDDDADDGVPSYQELRELAAEHMRSHREEFLPYLVPEDEGEDPAAYYDRYCDNIEMTATWGGAVELQALSGALGRRITVYAVGMAPQVLGEACGGEGLTLCYLRHAYGLGEHYNSTKRLLFAPGAAAGGGGGEEGGGEEDGGDK